MNAESSSGPAYPSPPTVPWKECPIATSLHVLGRKWTLTILRDVAFYPQATFSQIRKGNPGLRPRTLSLRLRELASQGLVRKVTLPGNARHPYYELTPQGLEVWPILSALLQFGIHNLASTVFADGRPRKMEEVYPRDAELMLGPMAEFMRNSGGMPVDAPLSQSPSRTAASRATRPTRR